jgi:acyl-CoA thioesterase-2
MTENKESNSSKANPDGPATACETKDVLEELLNILKLEKIEENIFRGQNVDLGIENVFGGQALGQALSAASQTVPSDRQAHSMHGYFLRHGDIRDGKSFTTRRVVAVQKGRAIFNMAASFHIREPGFDHQDEMPDIPGPEEVPSEKELAESDPDQLPPKILKRILCGYPIEMRHVNPMNPYFPEKTSPRKHVWFRTTGPMPDDQAIHRYVLAYASDFNLVATTLYPHGHTYWEPDVIAASLDHAMWFHREFRIDDWLLYTIESPTACNARGLSIGRIFNRQGQLVATATQEGLIRYLALYKK